MFFTIGCPMLVSWPPVDHGQDGSPPITGATVTYKFFDSTEAAQELAVPGSGSPILSGSLAEPSPGNYSTTISIPDALTLDAIYHLRINLSAPGLSETRWLSRPAAPKGPGGGPA
jgi:hypothetical protein